MSNFEITTFWQILTNVSMSNFEITFCLNSYSALLYPKFIAKFLSFQNEQSIFVIFSYLLSLLYLFLDRQENDADCWNDG